METYGLNWLFLRRLVRLLTFMMGGTWTMANFVFALLILFAAGYEVRTWVIGC